MNERLVQALIRGVLTFVLAGIAALLAWLGTEEARDLIGAWYIYVPIITAALSTLAKALGGETYQVHGARGRAAAAGPDDRPNALAI